MMKSIKFVLVVLAMILTTERLIGQPNFWQLAGLDILSVEPIAINSSGHVFAGTTWPIGPPEPWYIFRSTDNGNNWTKLNVPWSGALAINSSGDIFSASPLRVFRSTNNGTTWDSVNTGLPNGRDVISLGIDKDGHVFAGTYLTGVYRSTNNGDNWIHSGLDSVYVNAFAVSGIYFFAGATPGYLEGGVFRSTDGGNSWTQTALTNVSVTALASSSGGHIFARTSAPGDSGVVIRSTDNGNTWIPMIVGGNSHSLTINSTGHIFVGTSAGICRSTDNGATWDTLDTGPADRYVGALAVTPSGYIFAGTDSGVYRSVQPTTSVREVSSQIPASFIVDQNYPNPFNPSTEIRYVLPLTSHVSLAVFDLLGREVALLVNEEKPVGMHSVTWDATGLPSGVYFCRLQSKNFSETRKLLLMR